MKVKLKINRLLLSIQNDYALIRVITILNQRKKEKEIENQLHNPLQAYNEDNNNVENKVTPAKGYYK